MHALRSLGRTALERLTAALVRGRLFAPFDEFSVAPYVPGALCTDIAYALDSLSAQGFSPAQMAVALRLLVEERVDAQSVADKVQLVWSGIEIEDGTRSRETATIVQDLFARAARRIIIASYVLDAEDKARAIFGRLAERMDDEPGLSVRIYINIKRPWKDPRADGQLVREFSRAFREKIWPGRRLPEVFYDPRSLASGGGPRACLHAKCIIVDDEDVLITSANFTEAAHERNIEAGVRVHDPQVAEALRIQFETLAERGLLVPLPDFHRVA